jgi:hypothetical protein
MPRPALGKRWLSGTPMPAPAVWDSEMAIFSFPARILDYSRVLGKEQRF